MEKVFFSHMTPSGPPFCELELEEEYAFGGVQEKTKLKTGITTGITRKMKVDEIYYFSAIRIMLFDCACLNNKFGLK